MEFFKRRPIFHENLAISGDDSYQKSDHPEVYSNDFCEKSIYDGELRQLVPVSKKISFQRAQIKTCHRLGSLRQEKKWRWHQ